MNYSVKGNHSVTLWIYALCNTVRDKKNIQQNVEFHAHAFITICNVFASGKRFTNNILVG